MLFSSSLGIFKYLFFFYHTDNARPRHPPAASRHLLESVSHVSSSAPKSPSALSWTITTTHRIIAPRLHQSLTPSYTPLRLTQPERQFPSPSKFLQQYHAASLTLSENSVALLVALVIVLYCSSSNHQRSVRSLVAENPK